MSPPAAHQARGTGASCARAPARHPGEVVDVDTPVGLARVHRWVADTGPPYRGRLVLGHGAGGQSWSADLLALTCLTADGWDVLLVEQPWRVAGRRVAVPPKQLDVAWTAVLGALPALPTGGELVVGGRSAGARVACRTGADVGADAVLALAFPLHPPGRPERSRGAELIGTEGLPVLVVQGHQDQFGRPDEFDSLLGAGRVLIPVAGGHGFGSDCDEVTGAAKVWLAQRGPGPADR